MDKHYADTVRLLLNIAPDVFDNDIFAMKGGTAINLFLAANVCTASCDLESWRNDHRICAVAVHGVDVVDVVTEAD